MSSKVLVVDNDFFFVEFLSDLLSGRGYHVIKAYDGKEAIGLLESDSFDLVFLDMVMPKIDGEKVIKYVRARFPDAGFPIVALSGSIIERLDELGEIGADYYIAKGPLEKMEVEIVRFIQEFEISGPDFGAVGEADRYFEPKHLYPRQETAEMMEAVEFQKSIIESLAHGVIVLDRDTRLIQANLKALNILGLGMEDLLNRLFASLFAHRERPLLLEALKELATGGAEGFYRMSVDTATVRVMLNMTLLKVGSEVSGWVVVVEEGAGG